MIKYHPQNSLDNIAQIHYAGIKNIIDTRLKLLLEFLRYRKDINSLNNPKLSELDKKILPSGKNLETACMYRIAGKYRGENESILNYLQSINDLFIQTTFFNLLNYIEKNLKKIITGHPTELLAISKRKNKKITGKNVWDNGNIDYKEILKWLFPYEEPFRSPKNDTNWSAAKLADKLNAPVCLYCNRTHITNYESSKHKDLMTFTGQFDHFYDKDKHPLLRLSFYNLIPSCTLCNTTLKTSAATTTKPLVHPYFAGFDSVSPAVTFGVTPPFLSAPPTNFEITLEVSPGVDNEDEVRESLHVFQLSEIYQTHKDLVRDLHSKMHLFNADSLKDLKRSLKPSKVNANISKEECFRLYFGTSPDISEYQLRPMSKFNRDIMVNLGFSFD